MKNAHRYFVAARRPEPGAPRAHWNYRKLRCVFLLALRFLRGGTTDAGAMCGQIVRLLEAHVLFDRARTTVGGEYRTLASSGTQILEENSCSKFS